MLLNAFSLNMLDISGPVRVVVSQASIEDARREVIDAGSGVGHPQTAAILTAVLGTEVAPNRVSLDPAPRGRHIVAQYRGPRLPEGATELPEEARFDFLRVEFWPDALGD